MKLLSFELEGKSRLGVLNPNGEIIDLTEEYPTALAFLEAGDAAMALAAKVSRSANPTLSLNQVRLLPPVPQARKLLALAGNYSEHIKEGGRPTYAKEETYPYFFMKPPSTALIGSGATVLLPKIRRKMDYEGELVIVIGKRGRHIPVDSALEYVAGYTILNDVSERGLASKEPPKVEREQNRFFDWLVGKWFDTCAPCGPFLVTRDEVPDAQALAFQTRVNGEVRQDGNTSQMIFTVPEVVAFISRVLTLEPGDLISTGTPGGVGSAKGLFLQPGDVVDVEFQGLGVLHSPMGEEG